MSGLYSLRNKLFFQSAYVFFDSDPLAQSQIKRNIYYNLQSTIPLSYLLIGSLTIFIFCPLKKDLINMFNVYKTVKDSA